MPGESGWRVSPFTFFTSARVGRFRPDEGTKEGGSVLIGSGDRLQGQVERCRWKQMMQYLTRQSCQIHLVLQ